MNEVKETKIRVREDDYFRVTSTLHGHNLDVIAFNAQTVARDYPKIAKQILKIMSKMPSGVERVERVERKK